MSDINLYTFVLPHPTLLSFSLINADFCVAGCLIAYGACLGKVSPVQCLVLTLFGVTLFAVEEYIILSLLHVCPTKHTAQSHHFQWAFISRKQICHLLINVKY